MKPQFQHQLVTSFTLWLDHMLLCKGDAFQNITSTFYLQADERLDSNYISFASPHKQWVADASVKGAKIIDGVSIDNYFVKRGAQGIKYDFDNGRILVPRDVANPSSYVEGLYSVKDFNIYITDQTEEELLIETKFDKNSRFDQDIFEGIKPYDQVVPAIFVSYERGENIPFAFGGEDITESRVRCVIFAENSYQLDGAFSILKDLNTSTVANVGFNEYPLNEFGDLKFGHFDYDDLASRYYNFRNSNTAFHVEKVTVSKLSDRVAKRSHPGLFIGFVDFQLRSHRFPRAPLYEPVASRPPTIGNIPVAPYELTLVSVQSPLSPFNLELDSRQPYPPYSLFLTKTRHQRLQAGEVANVVVLQGGKLIVRLDGNAGQIAYLDILGQSIKIGSTASDNLIWDGHEFTSTGEKITRTIAGSQFQIEWVGRGSQIFEITRLTGGSYSEFDVSVYIPCSKEDIDNFISAPYVETSEPTPCKNRIPSWTWTEMDNVQRYEIYDVNGDIISTQNTEYSLNKIVKDGTYSIKVRVIDMGGKTSDWSSLTPFIVDTTGPLPKLEVTMLNTYRNNYVEAEWDDDSSDSTREYDVVLKDELAVEKEIFEVQTTTDTTFKRELRSGRYSIQVIARDALGNRSESDEIFFSLGTEVDLVRVSNSNVPIVSFSIYSDGWNVGRSEQSNKLQFPLTVENEVILRPMHDHKIMSDLIDTSQNMILYLDDGSEVFADFVKFNDGTPYYTEGKYAFFKLQKAVDAGKIVEKVELFMKP